MYGYNILKVASGDEDAPDAYQFGPTYCKRADVTHYGEQLLVMIACFNEEMKVESKVSFNAATLGILLDKLLMIVRVLRRPRSSLVVIGSPGTYKLNTAVMACKLL